MSSSPSFEPFDRKMREAGLSGAAIAAFRHSYGLLAAGATGLVAETEIAPAADLPRLDALPERSAEGARILPRAVVLKLNGGLGTSMGLERAKSLLEVKPGLAFLDLIARQALALRKLQEGRARFLLMNSFSTSADSRARLAAHPGLGDPAQMELLQSRVPKVDAHTLAPSEWPAHPSLEWCPPGHGDLYPSLLESGWLDRLVGEDAIFLFVSNADNLGATLDPSLLAWFAESGLSFAMEVAERTEADRKGGHLARRRADGRFLLRESAQCPKADEAAFQDVKRHGFFNTNSLWIRLDHLRELLEKHGGFLPLPLIRNSKTLDPRDSKSPPVFQLETAMGAAIECFDRSGAIVVPRSRFVPVKTISDLLVLRSDAYEVTSDSRVRLANACGGRVPVVELDPRHARFVEHLDRMTAEGVPSLAHCRRLIIEGPIAFDASVAFEGEVTVRNPSVEERRVRAGLYRDTTVEL